MINHSITKGTKVQFIGKPSVKGGVTVEEIKYEDSHTWLKFVGNKNFYLADNFEPVSGSKA